MRNLSWSLAGLFLSVLVGSSKATLVSDVGSGSIQQILPDSNQNAAGPNVCLTPDCVVTAGTMLDKMGSGVDPCEDFYSYACDGFINDETRSPDDDAWSSFSDDEELVASRLKGLLETPVGDGDSGYMMKAKWLYGACLDDGAVSQINLCLELMGQLGTWPVTSGPVSGTWNASQWDFQAALISAISRTSVPFFSLAMVPDKTNSSNQIIEIDQSGLYFQSNKFYFGEWENSSHQTFIDAFTLVATALGGNASEVQQYAEDVWQFEKQMAAAFVSLEDRQDPRTLNNPMNITQFQALLDETQCRHISPNNFDISQLLGWKFINGTPASLVINVAVPNYFRKIGGIVMRAKSETLASYLIWNVVNSYASGNYWQFPLLLANWKQCVPFTVDIVRLGTSQLYVQKYFTKDDQTLAQTLVDALQQELVLALKASNLMDAETQMQAIAKARAISSRVGLINETRIYQILRQHGSRVGSRVTSLNSRSGRLAKKLLVELDGPFLNTVDVNAQYDPSQNMITVPAGILQKPFFNRNFPSSVAFGTIGHIIGHELMHAFDSKGRRYDKEGNLNNWWGNVSDEAFVNRSQCLVEQYNQYQVSGENINGELTLADNIADLYGVRLSYAAYKKWTATVDQLLPGLNVTSTDQQFFVSMAQVWCAKQTDQAASQATVTDVHSNPKYRVNGVLQNLPEFAKAFQCSKSAKLNPAEKCVIY